MTFLHPQRPSLDVLPPLEPSNTRMISLSEISAHYGSSDASCDTIYLHGPPVTAFLAGPQGQFFSGWTVPKHKEIGASAGSDYKCIAGNPVWVVIYRNLLLIWQRSYLEAVFSLPCLCGHITVLRQVSASQVNLDLSSVTLLNDPFNSKSLAPYANIKWAKLAYIQQLYWYFGILWRLYF